MNYISCTSRSSEKICSSSGDAQAKGKAGWNFQPPAPPLNANVLFWRLFFNATPVYDQTEGEFHPVYSQTLGESHPVYDRTQGSGAVFSLLNG
jgi:hypothetical protein